MKRRWAAAVAGALFMLVTPTAVGGRILVSQPAPYAGYGYGLSEWDNFTAALDAATGNDIVVTAGLSNLAEMLLCDGILLVARLPGVADQLSPLEASNLTAYLATGRRVAMVGEGNSWTNWNGEILDVVGSTYAGEVSGICSAVAVHELTAGAPTVAIFGGDGLAVPTPDATPLYDLNFATLWGVEQNALTILTISAISDGFWAAASNGQFATNIADWLASGPSPPPPDPIPEPVSFTLLGVGALVLWRRRRGV